MSLFGVRENTALRKLRIHLSSITCLAVWPLSVKVTTYLAMHIKGTPVYLSMYVFVILFDDDQTAKTCCR